MSHAPVLAVTSGEPAGVGPDLCLRLAEGDWPGRVVVLVDHDLIVARMQAIGVEVAMTPYVADQTPPPGTLEILQCPLVQPAHCGRLATANAPAVLDMLDRAIKGCRRGEFAAMVTAPVHKGVICDAGITFSGHTEYLAQATDTPRVVMMLVGGGMRVALLTTHLPLSSVPAAVTAAALAETLDILHHDLKTRFGVAQPRILVAGLNPHAGEGGHMGREEIDIIEPLLNRLRADGMQLVGPLPADTLFVPKTLHTGDAVLAMYHDQGLPVLKHASFGGGVNVTLGLPIVRTSVDHGTALDLAGRGTADPGSLFAAVRLAFELSAE